ncbi:MAG: hypothetical protein GX297_06615 [Treponema sp.]|jgi:hypothetical protein|nr:hypothetical protein [Treponema sp.]
MNKKIKKYIFGLIFSIAFIPLFAELSTFNTNLSSTELKKLEAGEILIRNIGTYRKISLNPVNSIAKNLISTIKDLKPPYLVEIIQRIPYKGNEHIFDTLRKELTDVEGYVGIPYYGERTGKWYKLYSSAVIDSKSVELSKTDMQARLEMAPFGIIPTHITIRQTKNELFYESVNTEPVKIKDSGVKIVDGMTCAKTNKMKSFVYAFRDEDYIILYGIGGVDAPNVPILKDKIDNSFINRVTTFCKFIFNKLK